MSLSGLDGRGALCPNKVEQTLFQTLPIGKFYFKPYLVVSFTDMHPNQILGTNSEYNQQRVNWIPLNDNQLEEFDSFVCSQEQMQDYLKEKKFKQRNSEISYRILNHWEKLGLIDNDRPQGKGWRKFSVIDIVWMEIIKELRNFGYSNDKILTVKRDLINRAESGIISKNILFIYYCLFR